MGSSKPWSDFLVDKLVPNRWAVSFHAMSCMELYQAPDASMIIYDIREKPQIHFWVCRKKESRSFYVKYGWFVASPSRSSFTCKRLLGVRPGWNKYLRVEVFSSDGSVLFEIPLMCGSGKAPFDFGWETAVRLGTELGSVWITSQCCENCMLRKQLNSTFQQKNPYSMSIS